MKILRDNENSFVSEDDGIVEKRVLSKRGNFEKRYPPHLLAQREIRALQMLQGMEGIQEIIEQINDTSFTSKFINFPNISVVLDLDPMFFQKLKNLFQKMEERGVLRIGINKDEVFVNPDGMKPMIIDFGEVLFLDEEPQWKIILTKWFNIFKIWDLQRRFSQKVSDIVLQKTTAEPV